MKLPLLQRITGVACATLLGATATSAIEINPTLDLSGYIVGSARWIDQDIDDGEGGTIDADDTTLDLDATKVLFNVKTDPVSGTVSFFAAGTDDVSVLDAYFSWNLGGGATLTAGKFLSWHGYEAFDIPNMLQITYSNANIMAIIPGYHQGIKFDFVQGDSKMGVALLDGVYDSDGEIDDGFGIEAYYTMTAGDVAAFFGLGYESDGVDFDGEHDAILGDLWVQYTMGATMLAGEVAYRSTDYSSAFEDDVDSYFVAGLVQHEMSEGNFVLFRASWGSDDFDDAGSVDFLKGTLAFRQTISDNFTLVEEVSYTDFDEADGQTFLGIQGRFTF